jgi:hypothetical protein
VVLVALRFISFDIPDESAASLQVKRLFFKFYAIYGFISVRFTKIIASSLID